MFIVSQFRRHVNAKTMSTRFKKGDLVIVKAYGRNEPGYAPENLWKITELEGTRCMIRNEFDQKRAESRGKSTSSHPWDVSLLMRARADR